MRIALFVDTYPPEINGVATSVKSLRDILVKHGNDVIVVTTNPFTNKVTNEDGVVRLPGPEMKKMYGYRAAGFYNAEAMKILRKFNPEIIHIQSEWGIGIFGRVVIKKLKCPSIYTYHTMYEDYTYYITKGYFDRIGKHIMRNYAKNIINHVDGVITPSEKTKDYMRRIGMDIYTHVIPTGVDFSRFEPSKLDQEKVKELKKKFNIDDNVFTLLSLGRIAAEKSVDFSIKCYKRFIEKYPEINSKMVIVGKGPAEEELKELVKTLGIDDKVVFTGPCLPSEVQYYYTLGNAFVSSSLSETQGLTYMEAMAGRLFVLGRYDHNLLDVIQEGTTGYFFENEDEFADKLYKAYQLHKNKDQTMLDEAIKAIDHYSIETFYKSVMEAYEHVIKQKW